MKIFQTLTSAANIVPGESEGFNEPENILAQKAFTDSTTKIVANDADRASKRIAQRELIVHSLVERIDALHLFSDHLEQALSRVPLSHTKEIASVIRDSAGYAFGKMGESDRIAFDVVGFEMFGQKVMVGGSRAADQAVRSTSSFRFASALQGIEDSLVEKAERVAELAASPHQRSAISAAVEEATAHGTRLRIDPSDIVEVRVRHLAIDVVIADGAIQLDQKFDAVHLRHTPISLFRESVWNGPGREAAVRHEDTHNLLDQARLSCFAPLEMAGKLFAIADSRPAIAAASLQSLTAEKLLDLMHEEIITGWESLRESRKVPAWSKEAWREYQTAAVWGSQAYAQSNLAGDLKRSIAESKLEHAGAIADHVAQEIERVPKLFKQLVRDLERSSFIADHLGEESALALEQLTVMLSPGQYRHIPSVLAAVSKEPEMVEALGATFDVLRDGLVERNLTLNAIEALASAVGQLDSAEKERLNLVLNHRASRPKLDLLSAMLNGPAEPPEEGVRLTTVGELTRYNAAVEKLETALGQDRFKALEREFPDDFFADRLFREAHAGWRALIPMATGLSEPERAAFERKVVEYIEQDLWREDVSADESAPTPEVLLKLRDSLRRHDSQR